MPNINDVNLSSYFPFPIQFATASMSVGTMSAGWITGAPICVLNNSGATPGTQTTRTATLMIADGNLQLGQQWLIIIFNSVTTNALTIAGGTGVTVTGTATVAGFAASVFSAIVLNVATPAITITRVFTFGGGATNFGAAA